MTVAVSGEGFKKGFPSTSHHTQQMQILGFLIQQMKKGEQTVPDTNASENGHCKIAFRAGNGRLESQSSTIPRPLGPRHIIASTPPTLPTPAPADQDAGAVSAERVAVAAERGPGLQIAERPLLNLLDLLLHRFWLRSTRAAAGLCLGGLKLGPQQSCRFFGRLVPNALDLDLLGTRTGAHDGRRRPLEGISRLGRRNSRRSDYSRLGLAVAPRQHRILRARLLLGIICYFHLLRGHGLDVVEQRCVPGFDETIDGFRHVLDRLGQVQPCKVRVDHLAVGPEGEERDFLDTMLLPHFLAHLRKW